MVSPAWIAFVNASTNGISTSHPPSRTVEGAPSGAPSTHTFGFSSCADDGKDGPSTSPIEFDAAAEGWGSDTTGIWRTPSSAQKPSRSTLNLPVALNGAGRREGAADSNESTTSGPVKQGVRKQTKHVVVTTVGIIVHGACPIMHGYASALGCGCMHKCAADRGYMRKLFAGVRAGSAGLSVAPGMRTWSWVILHDCPGYLPPSGARGQPAGRPLANSAGRGRGQRQHVMAARVALSSRPLNLFTPQWPPLLVMGKGRRR